MLCECCGFLLERWRNGGKVLIMLQRSAFATVFFATPALAQEAEIAATVPPVEEFF